MSHAPNDALGCFVANVCTMLQIQTHCTRFVGDLTLRDVLNLLCKYAVAWDDVAFLRIHMTFTVKEFGDLHRSLPFLRPSLHPMEMPKSPHPCRMSISTTLLHPSAVIHQASPTMPRPESLRESVAAVLAQLQLGLLAPSSQLPCPCRSSMLSFGWPTPEPDWFFGFDQHSVLKWPVNNFPVLARKPTNNFLVGIGILTLVLTFASFLAALLASFPNVVHIHWI